MQLWNDATAVEVDDRMVVRLARVHVHDRDAAVEQVFHRLDMNSRIRAHRPIADQLRNRDLRFGAPLDLAGIGNVLIALEGFWQEAPQLRGLPGLRLTSNHHELLDEHWQIIRISSSVGMFVF
jgi:hypothetical protein